MLRRVHPLPAPHRLPKPPARHLRTELARTIVSAPLFFRPSLCLLAAHFEIRSFSPKTATLSPPARSCCCVLLVVSVRPACHIPTRVNRNASPAVTALGVFPKSQLQRHPATAVQPQPPPILPAEASCHRRRRGPGGCRSRYDETLVATDDPAKH